MSPVELVLALVIAIACGGYVGLAYERYKHRDPLAPRQHYVTEARMSKLHVIRDEWHQPDINVEEDRDDR